MKKIATLIFGVFLLGLMSCSNDSEEVTGKTIVQVSVLINNNPAKEAKIYLFDSLVKEPNPKKAKAVIIASNQGTATFVLDDIANVTVTDEAQTLHFAILEPYATTSISVKKGETKSISITYTGLD